MYLTRAKVSGKVPIPRKGTKYVARAKSHVFDSVPVVVAVRDMLKLARTAKEVKEMIKNKILRINGKEVKDHRESVKLLNVFSADKDYFLSVNTTGKFFFDVVKKKGERICKVIGQKILKKGKVQVNLHDGSNVLFGEKINVGDSLVLDFSGKVLKVIKFEKGQDCFVFSGRYTGRTGKIDSLDAGKVKVVFGNSETIHELEKGGIVVI